MDAQTGRQRGRFLSKNKKAVMFHKELVRKGYVSDDDFWEGYKRDLQIEEMLSAQQRGKSGLKKTVLDGDTEMAPSVSEELGGRLEQTQDEIEGRRLEAGDYPEDAEGIVGRINNHSVSVCREFCKVVRKENMKHGEEGEGKKGEGRDVLFSVVSHPVTGEEKQTAEEEHTRFLFFELLRHFWHAANEASLLRMERVFNGLWMFYKNSSLGKKNTEEFLCCLEKAGKKMEQHNVA
ncbi:MAG: uncharacterized protein A8A55_0381 [Amphiamblys sp. WSBS2006]|nr:MAG: uncharacterized protein A8A55_0381 [Amphiamblys sp. WSBS2006]